LDDSSGTTNKLWGPVRGKFREKRLLGKRENRPVRPACAKVSAEPTQRKLQGPGAGLPLGGKKFGVTQRLGIGSPDLRGWVKDALNPSCLVGGENDRRWMMHDCS